MKRETLRCATSGKGGTGEIGVSLVSCMNRSMKFGVRSSEHLELRPRTVVRPAFPARPARYNSELRTQNFPPCLAFSYPPLTQKSEVRTQNFFSHPARLALLARYNSELRTQNFLARLARPYY
jgi:hypothetical protein